MVFLNILSLILLLIGGLNWGLVGIFQFNLVEFLFGGLSFLTTLIYVLVAIAAIWLIIAAFAQKSIFLCRSAKDKSDK